MIQQPNNTSTSTNPVGRFMVAVGAVIEQSSTKKVLLLQRHATLDWHPGEWEVEYGRIDQFEDPEAGLHREIAEETGITDLTVGPILRVWHIYRGPQTAENDLIGITYACQTRTQQVTLSAEHQAYKWVTVEEALQLIFQPKIRQDVELFQKLQKTVLP